MKAKDRLYSLMQENRFEEFCNEIHNIESEEERKSVVNAKYQPFENTLLIEAVAFAKVPFARFLLENEAEVEADNRSDITALIKAVQTDNLEMVQLLLQFGANPLRETRWEGKTALEFAVENGNPEIHALIVDSCPKTQRDRKQSGRKRLSEAIPKPRLESLLSSFYRQEKIPWNRGRITLLGESGVGKTSLATCLRGSTPSTSLASTIGIAHSSCEVVAGEAWREVDSKWTELNFSAAQYVKVAASSSGNDGSFLPTSTPAANCESLSNANHGSSSMTASEGKVATETVLSSSTRFESIYRCFEEDIFEEHALKISVFDFAGQDEFKLLHSLFLSRYGVYLLLFNLRDLLETSSSQTGCLEELSLWWNSVITHTAMDSGMRTAPIVLIGTHKDHLNPDTLQYDLQRASTILTQHFKQTVAWKQLMTPASTGSPLCYFPVNNLLGDADPVIAELQTCLVKAFKEQTVFKEEIPLWWLQFYDSFPRQQLSVVTLEEVKQLVQDLPKEGDDTISTEDVKAMLRHFHHAGMLLWISVNGSDDIDSLEDDSFSYVIFDPICFFVRPVSELICNPNHPRHAAQLSPRQEQAKELYPRDWQNYHGNGILSKRLLDFFLSEHPQPEVLIQLMIKFIVLVPVTVDPVATLCSSRGHDSYLRLDEVENYLVPSLFPCEGAPDFRGTLQSVPRQMSRSYQSLFSRNPKPLKRPHRDKLKSSASFLVENLSDPPSTFFFSFLPLVNEGLRRSSFLPAEIGSDSYYPLGIFQRLLGKTISSFCQLISLHHLKHYVSYFSRSEVWLSMGNQVFRMKESLSRKVIRVDVFGLFPLPIFKRLEKILQDLLLQHYSALSLQLLPLVPSVLRPNRDPPLCLLSEDSLDFPPTLLFWNLRLLPDIINEIESVPVEVPPSAANESNDSFRRIIPTSLLLELYGNLMDCSSLAATVNRPLSTSVVSQAYDFFLSYNWNDSDAAFVESLWSEISLFNLYLPEQYTTLSSPETRNHSLRPRQYRVFYDKVSNFLGDHFQERFVDALLHTEVWVPIISIEVLQRWQSHNPDYLDNLLLEWTLMVLFQKSIKLQSVATLSSEDLPEDEEVEGTEESGIRARLSLSSRKIIPIMMPVLKENLAVSASGSNAVEKSYQIEDFFSHEVVKRLSENTIVPTAVLSRAIAILKKYRCFFFSPEEERDLLTFTIAQLVSSLLGYLGLKTFDFCDHYLSKGFWRRSESSVLRSPQLNRLDPAAIPLEALKDLQQFVVSCSCKRLLREFKKISVREGEVSDRKHRSSEDSSLSSSSSLVSEEGEDQLSENLLPLSAFNNLERFVSDLSLEEVRRLQDLCHRRLQEAAGATKADEYRV